MPQHPNILSTRIRQKLILLALISFAIWMLRLPDVSAWKALGQHEPSARILRSIFEMNLILFGTAFSIYVWSKTIGLRLVGELLFFEHAMVTTLVPLSTSGSQHHADGELVDYEGQDSLQRSHDLKAHFDNDNDHESTGQVRPRHHDRLSGPSQQQQQQQDKDVMDEDSMNDDDEEHPLQLVPSAESVFSAALDVLLILLVTLFLYTMSSCGFADSSQHYQIISRIAAPIFPLLLFIKLGIMLLVPWKARRKQFWTIVWYTMGAPIYEVTFRDGFVGDIITSSVRPLQDISFTLVYLLYGLKGWWSQSYFEGTDQTEQQQLYESNSTSFSYSFVNKADSNIPVMEKSWLLHTILLPICAVSPLWWRFLQNLRQVYDSQQRWPYLGNALKYFVAAQVAVTGVFYPEWKQSFIWLFCFVVATLYQIWWDVFMDWGLYCRVRTESSSWFGSWRLRKERLYSSTLLYWLIAIINVILRFGWTLSFIPTRYLSAAGVLTNTFTGDVSSILNPLIASAEIIRRTLWGLLRFEYEAIKVGGTTFTALDESSLSKRHASDKEDVDGLELVPMKMQSHSTGEQELTFSTSSARRSKTQVLLELCAYATIFAGIGIVAAFHRGTL